jgi:hypothetical protein
MMCYKDMAFCTFWRDCKDAAECHRPYTDKVEKEAWAWMEQPPVAFFAAKPDCHKKSNMIIQTNCEDF